MRGIDDTGRFGIYILTYPGDFHLSTVLVRSIKRFNPDVPIMIIPGEGFDREYHPFDVPIMPEPSGPFLPTVGYQDRKIWAFQGPFEIFLYLDADTICLKSLDPLIERISQEKDNFFYVQPWIDEQEWQSVIRDPAHPKHEAFFHQAFSTIVGKRASKKVSSDRRKRLPNRGGPLANVDPDHDFGPLSNFDPDHDFLSRSKFNTGVFASRRLAIKESHFESLNRAEREFYHGVLGIKEWTWQSSDLFFSDQGRINYLAEKLSIPIYPLSPELICRTGGDAIAVSPEDVERGTCQFHVVHWTGPRPSPSFFCSMPLFRIFALLETFVGRRRGEYFATGYEWLSERVAYSLWRQYYEQLFGPMALRERLTWSWRDFKRLRRFLRGILKFVVRSIRSG